MSQGNIAIPPSVTESEAKLYLSMKLFEIGRLSCGQAAELAGYSSAPTWNCWAGTELP